MSDLKEKEFEINGKKVGIENTTIRFSVKTLVWILGILYAFGAWAYFDLRSEMKKATEISNMEKGEFMKEVENKWGTKFDKMFEEISEMKGDIKVILDRQTRDNPIQANPNARIIPIEPPANP